MGPPKTDGSRWRVLTKRGPLEKGTASHLRVLALRSPEQCEEADAEISGFTGNRTFETESSFGCSSWRRPCPWASPRRDPAHRAVVPGTLAHHVCRVDQEVQVRSSTLVNPSCQDVPSTDCEIRGSVSQLCPNWLATSGKAYPPSLSVLICELGSCRPRSCQDWL